MRSGVIASASSFRSPLTDEAPDFNALVERAQSTDSHLSSMVTLAVTTVVTLTWASRWIDLYWASSCSPRADRLYDSPVPTQPLHPKQPVRTGEFLATNVASRREREGITQEELAQRSGLSRKTISRIELGYPVRRSNIEKLARALGCRVEALITSPPVPRGQKRQFQDWSLRKRAGT